MSKLTTSSLFFFLFAWAGLAVSANNEVTGLRFWTAPDHTRLVFDVSSSVDYKLFQMKKPDRLVVDLSKTRVNKSLDQPSADHPLIKRVRSATRNNSDLRVVFDLKNGVKPKSFFLKPNKNYGNRLVIDLYDKARAATAKAKTVKSVKSTNADQLRDLVIAIDAGHGGEDPGARGPRGVREKDVVFAISRKLEKLLQKEPGMRPVMVRKGDYYVGLRDRMEIARQAKADLFISIHADAFRDSKVKGASVYTLSRKGATSEAARWLAASENSADLVGGVSLNDKDDLLASVLLDLSQTATQESSKKVAGEVLKKLGGTGKLHKKTVQQAGFLVLKSPDIPSILVETAFISNPHEEKKLRSSKHQEKIARAIMSGVRGYFAKTMPMGTRYASRKHIIRHGDTLSHLASRYGVTTKELVSFNALKSTKIKVGQVIKIPG